MCWPMVSLFLPPPPPTDDTPSGKWKRRNMNHSSMGLSCNLLLSIARFPEGDLVILNGQGGEASMEISTRDITKVKNK